MKYGARILWVPGVCHHLLLQDQCAMMALKKMAALDIMAFEFIARLLHKFTYVGYWIIRFGVIGK